MDELSEEDKLTVARARKIQRFLSQPFQVAEVFTGHAGKLVPLQETIKVGFVYSRSILLVNPFAVIFILALFITIYCSVLFYSTTCSTMQIRKIINFTIYGCVCKASL